MANIPQTRTRSNTSAVSQQAGSQKNDPVGMQMFMQRLRSQQNLSGGIVAGTGAAIVGAVLWASVTAITEYQIGWMAIGIGFLVGFAVRKFGQGVDRAFGLAGAGLALFGCMLGNLLTVCIAVAYQFDVSFMEVISSLNGVAVSDIVAETFQPMDLLFYGIALWAGYKYSVRTPTEAETEMFGGAV